MEGSMLKNENNATVDILLITWNRKEYVEKTLNHLLSDNSTFNLYCWDNGSTDGTSELVASYKDARIKKVYQSKSNVMQAEPTRWFLKYCTSEVIGKIDDDTLAPHGWIDKILPLVSHYKNIGMIGCWTFLPEDYERNKESADKKVIHIDNHSILQNFWIGGTAFLMRKELALKYLDKGDGTAFPVKRGEMSIDGCISGWYFPLLVADHMDDPRSINCMVRDGDDGEPIALTAKVRGFKTQSEFLEWIKIDADNILTTSFELQKSQYLSEKPTVKEKIKKKISSMLGL